MSFVDTLTSEERIERAKLLTDKLVDHTCELLAAAENNAIVLYSDMLARQIPKSYAAKAFNEMQRSMHYFHLVRLCAVWDRARSGRESLPTVVALISTAEIIKEIAKRTYIYHANQVEPRSLTPTADLVERKMLSDHWKEYRVRRAVEEEAKVLRWLRFATRIVPRVENGFVKASLRPFRDNYLAHNLDPSANGVRVPLRFRYGDEGKLLRLTVRAVDRLHMAVNGSSFDWEATRKYSERNARDLWSSCTFDLK